VKNYLIFNNFYVLLLKKKKFFSFIKGKTLNHIFNAFSIEVKFQFSINFKKKSLLLKKFKTAAYNTKELLVT
jgi:hypothetical protein